MHSLKQDLRNAVRAMAKNRGVTAVAVLALALGISANTVIFSVVNAALIRALPFPDSDRIVLLFECDLQQQDEEAVAAGNFLDWRDQNHIFESIAAYREEAFNLTGNDKPERAWGLVTTSGLFPTLGVKPIMGRVFQPEDENQGAGRVAVISESLWERRFGADPNAIGRKLVANGEPLTVIGVMPSEFKYPEQSDLWVPPRGIVPEHPLKPNVNMAASRDSHYLSAVGRLRPGVTLARARADMDAVARRIEEANPTENKRRGVILEGLREHEVGDIRSTLLVLLGAVGFVLLIACANVANLLLARATARNRELAIRSALGASRAKLVRQLLTESIVLAGAGGALGLLLALWGIQAAVPLLPATLPGVHNVAIDGTVLAFTFLVSFITGVAFGLVPALYATRTDVAESLKEGGRGGTGGARRSRARGVLVVAEIALSLVLLIGAGLMIRSFILLERVDPGFDSNGVLTMRLSLPPAQYPDSRARTRFFEQVVERLRSIPGVESAAAVSRFPLTPGNSDRGLEIEGIQNDGDGPSADYRVVTPGYFEAVGIGILNGRDFTEHDRAGRPGVVIVNETMARRYWPGGGALGKRLRIDSDDASWLQVVGVVRDVKHFGLDRQSHPEIYVPYTLDPWPFMTAVVRSKADRRAIAEAMRGSVWSVDRDLPIPEIKTTGELLSESVARRRFNTLLLSIFGAVALVMAAVGTYGVVSYSVTQRWHEIGIRMALGATPSDVLRLVVRQGMTLALIGIGIGLAASLALTRVMSSLLFSVSATDPWTFILVSMLLTGAALAASLVPARRATTIDPMVALRCE